MKVLWGKEVGDYYVSIYVNMGLYKPSTVIRLSFSWFSFISTGRYSRGS